jgi:hypothetical protein
VRKNAFPVLVSGPGVGSPKSPRDYARGCAQQAIGLLAHAFNACENEDLPYRYSKAVLDEFKGEGIRDF